MPVKGVEVVVVGGGIGGLTAALLLAEAGASVTLLERVAAPAEVGAGILLQANGLAVLEALGLGPALERGGRRLAPPVLRSATGRTIGELATRAGPHQAAAEAGRDEAARGRGRDGAARAGRGPAHAGGDLGQGRLLAIRRSRLHRVLLDAVSERPAIATRFGAEATAARPDGTVELRWRDREGGSAAELVVGADGLRSTVRAGGDFGARLAPTGRRYVRGLVAHPEARGAGPGPAALEGEYWTPLGLFGGAPVDEATTYFYAAATHPSVAAALAARDLAAFRALWSAALPPAAPVLAGVGAFDELLVNDVVRVDCRRWSDGRLVLLGDAAHAMAPNLGQGANSAMVDAAVLAAELAGDRPIGQALDRYQARRQAPVRRVQDRADQLARLSGLANPLLCLARDAVLRRLARSARAAARVDAMVQQEDPDALAGEVRRLSGGRRRPG